MLSAIKRFVASESAAGIVLAAAAAVALLVSNSFWGDNYRAFIATVGELRVGDWLVLSKPLVVWVNDLWMAVFFFLVGLEIKRELIEGELSSRQQAVLPVAAALGGLVVPALIYLAFTQGDAQAMRGWAIPAATDIAFALGVLMLLGSRVPASLKVFLTAVAIIDDLGAIVVIAMFYTSSVSVPMLAGTAVCVAALVLLNRAHVDRVVPYLLVGAVLWLFVLKSGVHATVAGVVTAWALPMRTRGGAHLLEKVEHALHPWVAFGVLPVFAFVNAGVSLQGVTWQSLVEPIPLGIAVGLVVGKTIGVLAASWLAVVALGAAWPQGASRLQFFATCVMCGIGFTMSLFIGGLAFTGLSASYEVQLKLGVLAGSLVSALIGTLIFVVARRAPPQDN